MVKHEHAAQVVVVLDGLDLQQVRTWAGKVQAKVEPCSGYVEVNIAGPNPIAVQKRLDQFISYFSPIASRRQSLCQGRYSPLKP